MTEYVLNSMFFLLAVIVISVTTFKVVDRVIDYRELQEKEQREHLCMETWQPPVIEQCDKETWDRIREGCDNASSN